MEREKSASTSPKKLVFQKKKDDPKDKEEPAKRMRLELLTQIKYTLVYDEQVDQAGIDKLLNEYEKQAQQQSLKERESQKPEQIIDAISGEVIDVTAENSKRSAGDDLFLEVQEEEKLDE